MFSAPTLVVSNDRGLPKPLGNPSLPLEIGLNRFDPCEPSFNIPPGVGRGGEDSTWLGERANARGGEEERRTIADILDTPKMAHRGEVARATSNSNSYGRNKGHLYISEGNVRTLYVAGSRWRHHQCAAENAAVAARRFELSKQKMQKNQGARPEESRVERGPFHWDSRYHVTNMRLQT